MRRASTWLSRRCAPGSKIWFVATVSSRRSIVTASTPRSRPPSRPSGRHDTCGLATRNGTTTRRLPAANDGWPPFTHGAARILWRAVHGARIFAFWAPELGLGEVPRDLSSSGPSAARWGLEPVLVPAAGHTAAVAWPERPCLVLRRWQVEMEGARTWRSAGRRPRVGPSPRRSHRRTRRVNACGHSGSSAGPRGGLGRPDPARWPRPVLRCSRTLGEVTEPCVQCCGQSRYALVQPAGAPLPAASTIRAVHRQRPGPSGRFAGPRRRWP